MDNEVPFLNMSPEIILVCSFCGKRRDNLGKWQPVDDYFEKYPYAYLSHGICPECAKFHYSKEYEAICRQRKVEGM